MYILFIKAFPISRMSFVHFDLSGIAGIVVMIIMCVMRIFLYSLVMAGSRFWPAARENPSHFSALYE